MILYEVERKYEFLFQEDVSLKKKWYEKTELLTVPPS